MLTTLSKPFQTKRMAFRLLSMEDLPAVYRQFSDPEMCRFFSDPPCSWEEARGIIEHYQDPEGKGYLRYGMFDKGTGAFIGTCGYHYLDRGRSQVEVGYDVWKEYWRQGYISEALPVLIELCFEVLGVECVYVLVHPDNVASIATARKFGFRECEPCREYEGGPQLCMKLLRVEG